MQLTKEKTGNVCERNDGHVPPSRLATRQSTYRTAIGIVGTRSWRKAPTEARLNPHPGAEHIIETGPDSHKFQNKIRTCCERLLLILNTARDRAGLALSNNNKFMMNVNGQEKLWANAYAHKSSILACF